MSAETQIQTARPKTTASPEKADKQIDQSELVTRSMTLRAEQYDTISSYAAYNKLRGMKPDNTSAIVRDALSVYFAQVGEDFWNVRKMLGGR